VEVVDVVIGIEYGEGRTFKGVSPKRQAAQAKAFQKVFPAMQRRGVRFVSLGNGLYPTAERAEQFGVSREDLGRLMYGGLDTDYGELESTAKRLRAALAGGKELRVTNASGTDLRVAIGGRPVQVSDGIISAEDRKSGGPALSAWLPAGEVYLTPRAGSAEGVLVADRYFHQGDRVEGLRLEIKSGKVVGMSAKSGVEGLKARYDAAGAGRDVVGVVDIGINPSIQVPAGSAVNVWSRAGAVTVMVGNNVWAGGDNSSDFGLPAEVQNATVTVDGTELVKDGKLVSPAAVTAR
jgi:aminopeptidase